MRPRRVVRFARLIHRRVRVLGVPSARAAYVSNMSLTWLPRRVVPWGSASYPNLGELGMVVVGGSSNDLLTAASSGCVMTARVRGC